jgi:hypothetical protein
MSERGKRHGERTSAEKRNADVRRKKLLQQRLPRAQQAGIPRQMMDPMDLRQQINPKSIWMSMEGKVLQVRSKPETKQPVLASCGIGLDGEDIASMLEYRLIWNGPRIGSSYDPKTD